MSSNTGKMLAKLASKLSEIEGHLHDAMNLRDDVEGHVADDLEDAADKAVTKINRSAEELCIAIFGGDEYLKRHWLLRTLQDALAKIDALPLDVRLKLTERRD